MHTPYTSRVRPVIGHFEPTNLDEASNRIPPTSQVSSGRMLFVHARVKQVGASQVGRQVAGKKAQRQTSAQSAAVPNASTQKGNARPKETCTKIVQPHLHPKTNGGGDENKCQYDLSSSQSCTSIIIYHHYRSGCKTNTVSARGPLPHFCGESWLHRASHHDRVSPDLTVNNNDTNTQ